MLTFKVESGAKVSPIETFAANEFATFSNDPSFDLVISMDTDLKMRRLNILSYFCKALPNLAYIMGKTITPVDGGREQALTVKLKMFSGAALDGAIAEFMSGAQYSNVATYTNDDGLDVLRFKFEMPTDPELVEAAARMIFGFFKAASKARRANTLKRLRQSTFENMALFGNPDGQIVVADAA